MIAEESPPKKDDAAATPRHERKDDNETNRNYSENLHQDEPVCQELGDDELDDYETLEAFRSSVVAGWKADWIELTRSIDRDPLARETMRIFQHLNPRQREQVKGWLVNSGAEAEDLDNFPRIVALEDFMATEVPERKVLIEGILKKESKLVLSGQSKLGKTFAMMSLAMAIANDGYWLGFKCNRGTVLYVNLELHKDSTQQRFRMLQSAFGSFKGIDLFPLRGYAAPIEKIAERTVQRIKECGKDFDLIIIDPIYKTYGDRDENSAGDIAAIMNALDGVGMDVETSIAFVHHDTKSGTRLSGSGVFARDPDAIISLKPLIEENPASDIMVSMELRDFPPIDPFTVSRQGFAFTRTELPPAPMPIAVKHALEILKVLAADDTPDTRHSDIKKRLCEGEDKKLSAKQLDNGLKACRDNEWVSKGRKFGQYAIAEKGNEALCALQQGKNLEFVVLGKHGGKPELIHED